jgi:hypothetical protein
MRLADSIRTRRARIVRGGACDLLPTRHYSAHPIRDARRTRQQESAVKFLNRLAHREFLILVAMAASALTLHVRQHVIEEHPVQASHADYGRICEAPAASESKARVLPAECRLRASLPANRTHTPGV